MHNNQPIWQPSDERIANSQINQFRLNVNKTLNTSLHNYNDLYQWSIDHTGEFWEQVWQYCEVICSQAYSAPVVNPALFPNVSDPSARAKWFTDSRLNFAENLMRYKDDQTAMIGLMDNGQRTAISYTQLHAEVAKLASALRKHGIGVGDRVAGLSPNTTETVVAMLATTSIGAIWTSCSPDFGTNGACDRFGQTKPRILFSCNGYFYDGKEINCLPKTQEIIDRIDSIEKTIIVDIVSQASNTELSLECIPNAVEYQAFLDPSPTPLIFEQLPFDHPVYINYSSGTTGVPKCIVHGAGGTLIQHLKEHRLHTDVSRDDTLFYFTTCGWMMWNWLVSGLASGCTLVLFDGSPFAKNNNILLDAIDDEGITVFGTSAKYLSTLEKKGLRPKETHQLGSLKTILSTGSALSATSYDYVYKDFKKDVCLSSISGGTDIISCFVLGNPTLPVYRGEIQCLGLGMAVEIWDDDGHTVEAEKGELVCVKPFPSTPVGFWNDDDGHKFHAAYFDNYPNVWAHGDFGEITPSHGMIIHGRSDAILNPGGVRIGSAEIYRQVEKIDAVLDSVAVGQDFQEDVRVILFVVLSASAILDDNLIQDIKSIIRTNTTVRHVPAKIIQVADIPRTISGKIVEVAVKNTIHNRPVKNTDALANPEALALYKNLSELDLP